MMLILARDSFFHRHKQVNLMLVAILPAQTNDDSIRIGKSKNKKKEKHKQLRNQTDHQDHSVVAQQDHLH